MATTTTTAAKTEPAVRIVCLASGNGTNFQAILDATATAAAPPSPRIPDAQVVRLFVNRKAAGARQRAEAAGVPSEYFNLVSGGFQARGERDPARLREARARYDAALAGRVLAEGPGLVVLAGWMHVFSEAFLRPLAAAGVPVINLHPALPGKYNGAGAIERAFADFQAGRLEGGRTGIMVHYVIAEVDMGEPILTREVELREGEALGALEERIHAHEHELIVEATARVVEGILAERGGR